MELQEEWYLVNDIHQDTNTYSSNSCCAHSPTKTTTAAAEPLLIPVGLVVGQQHKEEEAEILVAGEDPISRVSFKKMKETEYVFDMKIDSPESNTTNTNTGIMPQIDEQINNKQQLDNLEKSDEEEDGFNLWTWGLMHGFAAICSFGLGAAFICMTTINKTRPQFSIHTNNKVV